MERLSFGRSIDDVERLAVKARSERGCEHFAFAHLRPAQGAKAGHVSIQKGHGRHWYITHGIVDASRERWTENHASENLVGGAKVCLPSPCDKNRSAENVGTTLVRACAWERSHTERVEREKETVPFNPSP